MCRVEKSLVEKMSLIKNHCCVDGSIILSPSFIANHGEK